MNRSTETAEFWDAVEARETQFERLAERDADDAIERDQEARVAARYGMEELR